MAESKKYLLLFLKIAIAVFIAIFLYNQAKQPGDFKVYLEAANLISEGKSPYNIWIFVSEGNYCNYFYSPLWAIMVMPLTYLPAIVANLIWLLLNLFFIWRVFNLLFAYFEDFQLSKQTKNILLLISLACSIRFIHYNFDMIQMTIFLLWGSLESMSLFRKQQHWKGALILALVINIKLLPIVLLPYLIYRREWKGFCFTLLFSGLFLILPAFILGFGFNNQLITEWLGSINPATEKFNYETNLGANGLSALIPSFFTTQDSIAGVRRHILNLNSETVTLIINIIRLLLISSVLFILKWPPFVKSISKIQTLKEIAYLLLLIPIIFPHQQKYAFILCLPAMMYLAFYLIQLRASLVSKNYKYKIVLILSIISFILMTLTTDGLIGRELNNYSQYYHTITWGGLLLVVALILTHPFNVKDFSEENSSSESAI